MHDTVGAAAETGADVGEREFLTEIHIFQHISTIAVSYPAGQIVPVFVEAFSHLTPFVIPYWSQFDLSERDDRFKQSPVVLHSYLQTNGVGHKVVTEGESTLYIDFRFVQRLLAHFSSANL